MEQHEIFKKVLNPGLFDLSELTRLHNLFACLLYIFAYFTAFLLWNSWGWLLVAITLKIAGKEKKLPLGLILRKVNLTTPESTDYQSLKINIRYRHHQASASGDLNINQNWHDILGSQTQTTRKHYFIAPYLGGWKLQSWPWVSTSAVRNFRLCMLKGKYNKWIMRLILVLTFILCRKTTVSGHLRVNESYAVAGQYQRDKRCHAWSGRVERFY